LYRKVCILNEGGPGALQAGMPGLHFCDFAKASPSSSELTPACLKTILPKNLAGSFPGNDIFVIDSKFIRKLVGKCFDKGNLLIISRFYLKTVQAKKIDDSALVH
jgi:hypothetical protein